MKNPEKPKVLIIHQSDVAANVVGGIQTYINGLIKYAPDNFEIKYIGVTTDKEKRPLNKWQKIQLGNKVIDFMPIMHVKNLNKKAIIPLSLRFTLALKQMPADIEDDLLLFNRIEPAFAFRKLKNPKILIVHSDIQKQMQAGKSEVTWSKFPFLYDGFEKKLISKFDYVYSVNSNTFERYKEKYNFLKSKLEFMPTWVDVDFFKPAGRKKQEVRKDLVPGQNSHTVNKKWLLFVGRLQEVKAPLRLIDSFAQYHKSHPDSCLLIVGEGNLKQKIQERINELSLEDYIYLIGAQTRDQLLKYYQASDLMLLTSNFEGMPMSVLEALACGVPVVSTDVGEIARLITNGFNGEIITELSAESIASGIKMVLDNQEKYSVNNCLQSIKRFLPQNVMAPLFERIRLLSK